MILLVFFIKNEIKKIPFVNKTRRFLVALEESSSPEKGFGYMTHLKIPYFLKFQLNLR